MAETFDQKFERMLSPAFSLANPNRQQIVTLAPLPELRLHLLRLAIDTLPRIGNGTKPDDVVARARELELYVLGPPSGSAQASDPAERGTGAPGTAPDAGPAEAGL